MVSSVGEEGDRKSRQSPCEGDKRCCVHVVVCNV